MADVDGLAWPERFAIVAFMAALILYGAYVALAIVTDPGEPLTADDWRNLVMWGVEFVGGVTAATWVAFRVVALVLPGLVRKAPN